MLAAKILWGAESWFGINREQAGQTGLLGAWSLSGAGAKILMGTVGFNPRIDWDFRIIFGNLRIRGGQMGWHLGWHCSFMLFDNT